MGYKKIQSGSHTYIDVPRLIPISNKEIILELEFIKFFY